jgi:uncharacterized protein YndB with AHSA1/START domain
MDAERDFVEREIRVAAPPETVFAFFTDADKMVQWKGSEAQLDPRPGGIYRVDVMPGNVARGQYVEVVPYSRVVFTWGWEGENPLIPPGGSTVEVTFVRDGDGTIVRLVHRDLATAQQRHEHAGGWDMFLPRLAAAAAGGDPGPIRPGAM